MKHIIFLYLICALLVSCKKDNKTTPTQKLYPVTFNLTEFSQTQIPIGKTKPASLATQAADSITVRQLYYMLYNETGSLIGANYKHSGDKDFGTFTDQISPGKYYAVFCGGSDSLNVSGDGDLFFTCSHTSDPFKYRPWDETFYKKVPLTVDNSGAAINQAVVLDRITSRLDIVIKDPIPAGSTRLKFSYPDTIAVSTFSGSVARPSYFSQFINKYVVNRMLSTADIGKSNYTITLYTLNNNAPFDLTVEYFGKSATDPIFTKTIKNVICKRNYRTILSGLLFYPGNTSFDIAVDPVWNTVNLNF